MMLLDNRPFFALVILPILFFIVCSAGISVADGEYHTIYLPGEVKEVRHHVQLQGARFDLEVVNGADNSSLILAADRTHRKNPLDSLKYYNGGWNITNKDYYASVVYTGAPLFLVAAIWFVVLGLCFLLTCICFCCCRKESYGYSKTAYALSVIALSLFTIAAVVGSIVLYTGQGKFHATTSDTLDYVVLQSDSTAGNLRNVSDYLAAAKNIQVDRVSLPKDIQNSIDRVDGSIRSAASTLEDETDKNKHRIKDILYVVTLALIIVAAVMLALALLGFLLSVLGLQCLVYVLVMLGWILVAITFILAGVFLAVHNVTGDTCVALDEWVKNPASHTALDDILPCVDRSTTQQTLNQSKEVTFQLAEVVNGIITNVSNNNFPPNAGPLYYNQSGPLVPVLCNPFNADLADRKCASGEVELSNATQVWKNYVCQVSGSNICTTVGRLTPTMYNQMASSVNVSYGLNHYGPFLSDLLDCTFVRDSFRTIHDEHCDDLKSFSEWIVIGLIMVSVAVALSLILWVLYAREMRHRKFTKMVDARYAQEPTGPKVQQ